MDILTSITMILSKQCRSLPEQDNDDIKGSRLRRIDLDLGLLFIAGVLGLCLTAYDLRPRVRHPPCLPYYSSAVIFMYRATFEMFPKTG
jgi:hypothetical protein